MVTRPYHQQATSLREGQRDGLIIRFLYGIEHALFFLCILFFTGAIMTVLFPVEAGIGEENALARLLWYPIYSIVILLALRILPQLIRLAVFNPILILCVLLCGASMFWSVDPALTLRRSIALLVSPNKRIRISFSFMDSPFINNVAFFANI